MTPLRALAIGCALAASRRWPALALVAGVLGAEVGAGELAAAAPAGPVSLFAWGSGFAVGTATGAHLTYRWSRPVAVVVGCGHVGLTVLMSPWTLAMALTTATACAAVAYALLARTTPNDAGRVAMALLLAGNVVACVFVALVGPRLAYCGDAVLWSNNLVHASIAGLALWTMRSR